MPFVAASVTVGICYKLLQKRWRRVHFKEALRKEALRKRHHVLLQTNDASLFTKFKLRSAKNDKAKLNRRKLKLILHRKLAQDLDPLSRLNQRKKEASGSKKASSLLTRNELAAVTVAFCSLWQLQLKTNFTSFDEILIMIRPEQHITAVCHHPPTLFWESDKLCLGFMVTKSRSSHYLLHQGSAFLAKMTLSRVFFCRILILFQAQIN